MFDLLRSRLSVDTAAIEHTLIVQLRPFSSTISVIGTIVPSHSTEVVAPFDGVVRQIGFEYGRSVVENQVLLVMDSLEIEQRKREAEAAYLKADEAETDMASWTTSPDVSRARRAVTAADLEWKNTQQKATETKGLLNRGLVARSEYDSLIQQQQTQAAALTAAQEDLMTVLKRGEGASRRVTTIELQNARARLADLNTQLSGAIVRASTTGLIVRPPAEKMDPGGGAIHVGQRLSRGQLVGSITRVDELAVSIKLDEADATRVSDGLPVMVTGPGFKDVTAVGHVSSVAGEALASEPGATSPSFAATAYLDGLSPEQTRSIRIGMSANVVITVYQTASTIVVPPQAVEGVAPRSMISVRDAQTNQIYSTPISIGAIAPDGVEVLSGLKPNDVVIWWEAGLSAASETP